MTSPHGSPIWSERLSPGARHLQQCHFHTPDIDAAAGNVAADGGTVRAGRARR